MRLPLAFIPFLCFQYTLCTVEAKTHTFSMTVGRIDGAPDGFYIPDGLFEINGWSPAPPIYVDTRDRVIATVTNSLKTGEGSLIHWHGLLQKGSNRMDGVPFVTQSLVMPGENFTYDFYVDLPGTYWYHSHYAEQYIEGLRGAFIARYKPDLAIYNDVALVLSDWYHENKTYALEKYLVPSGIPVSLLLALDPLLSIIAVTLSSTPDNASTSLSVEGFHPLRQRRT
jgi:iron transport multicopper oxidase